MAKKNHTGKLSSNSKSGPLFVMPSNPKLADLLFVFNKRKRPIVNEQLKKHLKHIVSDLIKKSARKEALEIMVKSSRERIGEFMYYYYSDSGNVACLVLDAAKDELVKAKIMKKGKKDTFGGLPY